ncbi:MAG: SLC13 family permease [Oscillospiraceae bacterium]
MRFLPSPDMSSITNCYSAELVFLLAGADIITMVWEITGVDKRIAAHSLALVGTSVRQQVVIWFLISTVLSAVLPNTVVAAGCVPSRWRCSSSSAKATWKKQRREARAPGDRLGRQ